MEFQRFLQRLLPDRWRRGTFADPPFHGYLERAHGMNGLLALHGWVVSLGPKIEKLTAFIGGEEIEVPYGYSRPDIGALYPQITEASRSGFALDLPWNAAIDATVEIWVAFQGSARSRCFTVRIHPQKVDALSPAYIPAAEIRKHPEPPPDLNKSRREYFQFLASQAAPRSENEYVPFSDHPVNSSEGAMKLIAFYLPQFHPIRENDDWWGKGFTEWTNVTRTVPQFLGHYQPRLPGELGFYDLRLLEVQKRQIELAGHYGIYGFCFHHYWFGGRRLLEKPFQQFLDNPQMDFPFCICWSNENWTRRWDGSEDAILIAQSHSPDDDIEFIRSLELALKDPRYIRINGRPLLLVYRATLLPEPAATVKRWKQYCVKSGIGDLFVVSAQSFGIQDPRPLGFDAAVEFPPHNVFLISDPLRINAELDIVNPEFGGTVIDYRSMIDKARALESPDYPLFRTVFPSWDNEARKPGRGYCVAFSSPEKYREWLRIACTFALSNPVESESIVFLNAWNEWGEAAYLEPDRRYGYAYLGATAETLTEYPKSSIQASSHRKIIYVAHDAWPNGSQISSVNAVRVLKERFGYQVQLILMTGGSLEEEFARHATINDFSKLSKQEQNSLIYRLFHSGYDAAICSSAVAGPVVEELKRAGMRVISLIHELPSLIRSYGLEESVKKIAKHADKVVFATPFVKTKFAELTGVAEAKSVVRPQGLYNLPETGDRSSIRQRVRRELSIPEEGRIILTVGYGDLRKGTDLLALIAKEVLKETSGVYFIWIGNYEKEAATWAQHDIKALGLTDRIRLLPFQKDVRDFYVASDVFLLASREDPFPSVVLEAMSQGLPVVGFENAGGFTELLDQGVGLTAPYLDIPALSTAILHLLRHPEDAAAMGKKGIQLTEEKFNFTHYVFDLLDLLQHSYQKISVIVPSYNYAQYLETRLRSIFCQSYPVYEVIVADDASTDDSVSVLRKLQQERGYDVRLLQNESNSGSVFRQWLQGVRLAKGDYVWIAEADDIADAGFLEKVSKVLDDPDVVLSFCQSRQVDENGNSLAEHYMDYVKDIDPEKWKLDYIREGILEIRDSLAVKNTIPNVSSVVFRRLPLLKVLEKNIEALSRFKSAGDWFAYVNLLAGGKIGFLAEALNNHRRHQKSVTLSSFDIGHLKEILAVQSYVARHHELDARTKALIQNYNQQLYEQFHLVSADHPVYASNPELGDSAAFLTSG